MLLVRVVISFEVLNVVYLLCFYADFSYRVLYMDISNCNIWDIGFGVIFFKIFNIDVVFRFIVYIVDIYIWVFSLYGNIVIICKECLLWDIVIWN